jgi:hypothetical protein
MGPSYAKALRFPSATRPSCQTIDVRWWRGHSGLAITVIVLIIFCSAVPSLLGYLIEPRGLQFTGSVTENQDLAAHEAYASEMAAHLTWQNLFTPEPTPRGLFVSPLDLFLGLIQRATGIPYMVLRFALAIACAPALAFSLMHLARSAGLSRPGAAAVVALLAGSFAPLVEGAYQLGLLHDHKYTVELVALIGTDATPTFIGAVQGAYIYLLLATLVLVVLPMGNNEDPGRGFRRAGVALSVMAMVYPYYVPTLGLTVLFCALLWGRTRGWKSMLKGMVWLGMWSGPPMMYWAMLPYLDPEYARGFAVVNPLPLFSIPVTLVSIGLGAGAIIGIPWLLRGNAYQQMLACFAAAFVVALNLPVHPWRAHLFHLGPVLIIATLAVWWPKFLRLGRGPRWILVAGFLVAAIGCGSRYIALEIPGLLRFAPPQYISTADVAAIQWIADQRRTDVVLARPDLSLFVAARGHHRVVVGHWSWTHQYEKRLVEVEAVFENGADPRSLISLIEHEQVAWVLIDGDRGVPAWAVGVDPAARFD